MVKLTKRIVDAVKPGGDRQILWDSDPVGFGLLVLPSGVRSFIVQYRTAEGRTRRLTLGRYGVLTVDEARKAAKQALARVAGGEDPVSDRRATRSAPLMNDLFDRYRAEHVTPNNAASTAGDIDRLMRTYLRPGIGTIRVNALTRADVARLHSSMRATPRRANFALAVLSKALALAELWGLRPEHSNPTRGVPRYPESHRTRFLSKDEARRLWKALREAETIGLPWRVDEGGPKSKHLAKLENRRHVMAWQSIATIRLLLLTGARLSEILGLQWKDVDFDCATIALPGRKGGARQPHPAGLEALRLLRGLPHLALPPPDESKVSPWVLPRERDPSRHVTKEVLEAAWHRIRDHAGLDGVRLHDLRHTFGTYASQGGANAFIVRDLLRHKDIGTTARYANFDASPVRSVMNDVSARVVADRDSDT